MWKVKHEPWCNDDGESLMQTGTYSTFVSPSGTVLEGTGYTALKTVCPTCFSPAKWVDEKKKKSGDTTTTEVKTGDGYGKVTFSKIERLIGKVDRFTVAGMSDSYKTPTDLMSVLVGKDGKPEAEHCYELTKHGMSANDIIVNHHADQVTMYFVDTTVGSMTVKEAAEKLVKSWSK